MFVPDRLGQLSLMIVGKARSLSLSGVPERCCTLADPSLTHKHTMLEMPTRDKHSSLSRKFVNCACKKFYNIGPRSQGLFVRKGLIPYYGKFECLSLSVAFTLV